MKTTLSTKVTYRSSKAIPQTKAYYVNKWKNFHEAFPNVPLEEWAKMNNLAPTTFHGWLSDPRYNKELREKVKELQRLGEEQLKKAKAEAEEECCKNETLPEAETEREENIAPAIEEEETPKLKVEVETTTPQGNGFETTGTDNYVKFVCADFRIEISKSMPAQDINRMIGYALSQASRYKNLTLKSRIYE